MKFTYKRLGDILLLQGMELSEAQVKARELLESASWAESVYLLEEIHSDTRTPVLKHLAGEQKDKVVHKELRTRFVIPIHETMFSPGNHYERLRLIKEIPKGSHVVDMFCAVGNLSMPLAVNREDVRVTGVEHHHPTFEALKETIHVNNVENRFTAIFGDNRVVTPKGIGDVVLMGFFGWDKEQFTVALDALKDKKGIVYLHYNKHGLKAPVSLEGMVEEVLDEKGLKGTIVESYVVKKSGPKKIHYVQKLQVE